MARLTDFNVNQQFKAVVQATKRLTPQDSEEIREIILEVQEPSFDCKVNQSFGVLIKQQGAFGNPYHHRLYSVADLPGSEEGKVKLTMLVKRCAYVDEFSGEEYPGVASNYLCDRQVGDELTVTGPHQLPFRVPEDKTANLILVGMGTGIAPFRAFVKNIYENIKDWEGQIRLFYGARSGLELLYMNDKNDDLVQYYDQETFQAFHALSPRPHWEDPIALETAIEDRASEVLEMLNRTNTYIYVAGYEKIREKLDKAFATIMGSKEQWALRKAELVAGGKWAEVIY
ncbi:MAG TPA: hypothetical protein VJ953_19095 [Saprospiraceae bacterium]|nr:hypothetical protein [Saprospiraceae bacterium]